MQDFIVFNTRRGGGGQCARVHYEEVNEEEEVNVYRVMQGPAEFRGNVNVTSASTPENHFVSVPSASFWTPSLE